MDNIDLITQAVAAQFHGAMFGKRGTKLWVSDHTIWSYETAIAHLVHDAVPQELFINVTKYTNITTRLQLELMRRFNPNHNPSLIVASVDNMEPRCHGEDLPRTYYELPVDHRYNLNWKMPQGWLRAKTAGELQEHYEAARHHSLTAFVDTRYGIYVDCCNCGAFARANVLQYNGEKRYYVFESKLNRQCDFPEVTNHA